MVWVLRLEVRLGARTCGASWGGGTNNVWHQQVRETCGFPFAKGERFGLLCLCFGQGYWMGVLGLVGWRTGGRSVCMYVGVWVV